ncbi:hypothetical protein B0H15DRAFT_946137 [Mycena belliarum]|uniref:DUF7137 domain-containing protein n=1 Tax=Mycena belliarum TaxID=1033014 RepID=A0AAD6U9Y3_9AGAR|nr:hypothetical protein B0H15DRAFT_946137 [Mycena belliae]
MSSSGSGSASAPPGSSSSAPPAAPPPTSQSNAISIALTNPAGGATITQPPQTATSYYKIAQNQIITFGWNLTSVIATPTSITISAACANGNTYAVGADPDGKVPGTATQVVWDVFSYQQAHQNTPLAPGTCTLRMWDDRGPTATARAGFMSPNTALAFALYTPQAYTPIASGWSCTGCSGALRNTPPALAGLFITLLVVIFSGMRILRARP